MNDIKDLETACEKFRSKQWNKSFRKFSESFTSRLELQPSIITQTFPANTQWEHTNVMEMK